MTSTAPELVATTKIAHPTEPPVIDPQLLTAADDIITTANTGHFLRGIGLPPFLEESWDIGYGQGMLPDGVTPVPNSQTKEAYKQMSVARLLELENAHKGKARELYDSNRIRNFGRLSLESLDSMIAQRDRRASRVLLFYAGVYDNNGAIFTGYEHYEQLLKAPPEDTVIELIEVGYPHEFTLGTERVRAHGDNATAHSVCIILHGNSHYADLNIEATNSGTPRRIIFDKTSAGTVFSATIAAITVPQTTVIMGSCKTGYGKQSIAQHINASTALRTYAPIEAVWIEELRIREREGILLPEVIYQSHYPQDNRWIPCPSITRCFRPILGTGIYENIDPTATSNGYTLTDVT